jgi:hypothetical protein
VEGGSPPWTTGAAITNVFDAAHEAQLAAEAPPSDGGFTHKALSLSAPRSLIQQARIDFLSEGLHLSWELANGQEGPG